MGFASGYLQNRVLFNPLSTGQPDDRTRIIIVIPAFDEPRISGTLNSLNRCILPRCGVEVLILVNGPSNATQEQINHNNECEENIRTWQRSNRSAVFHLACFNIGIQENPEWGAGLARKTIMDEALHRFNMLNSPDGIIVSLDADCLVSENYLQSLFTEISLWKFRMSWIQFLKNLKVWNRLTDIQLEQINTNIVFLTYLRSERSGTRLMKIQRKLVSN